MFPLKDFLLAVGVILVFLQTPRNSCAQEVNPADISSLYQILSSKNDIHNKGFYEVVDMLQALDSLSASTILNELEKRFADANNYFKTRFDLVKGNVKFWFYPKTSSSLATFICQKAINEAYETNDTYLIAFATGESGRLLSNKTREIELATTYLLQSVELYERLPSQPERQYRVFIPLGEILFHCREYEKSIQYTRMAIENWNDTGTDVGIARTRMYNTLAQNFEQLGMLDSAMYYYDISLTFSEAINNPVWKGLNKGFMGEILFKQKKYDLAKPLLEYDYAVNRQDEQAVAAKSLQWLARIDALNGETDSALFKARESLNMLRNVGTNFYLQVGTYMAMTYYTLADAHRANGNLDSFYHYFNLYSSLHDSLQGVVTLSSIKTSQIRIDNERNIRAIQLLEKEKKNEELKRNFLVVAILLSAVIVFLYLKRLRLKQQHKAEMAAHLQKSAESELKSAQEQMRLFTENIVGQTDLIEKLQSKLQHKELDIEQYRLIEEITHQTILTEEEWANFKSLFEKIYPGFFKKLRESARDITVAEQRIAALIRLDLTARQMASILGISVDGVHKSRQRLRQRLHLPADASLEKMVAVL